MNIISTPSPSAQSNSEHVLMIHYSFRADDSLLFKSSKKNTRMLRLLKLPVEKETLPTITDSFTDEAGRLNCANVQILDMNGSFARPENFHLYFPFL
jgi:hypothetical protein